MHSLPALRLGTLPIGTFLAFAGTSLSLRASGSRRGRRRGFKRADLPAASPPFPLWYWDGLAIGADTEVPVDLNGMQVVPLASTVFGLDPRPEVIVATLTAMVIGPLPLPRPCGVTLGLGSAGA